MSSAAQSSPREILRARAKALARRPESGSVGPQVELIEFAMAAERYAVELAVAVEVHSLEQFIPVPCAAPHIAGIVNVRGRLTAVVDIRKFFGVAGKGITDLHRTILVRHKDVEIGLLVDAVIGLRRVPLSALEPPLPTHTDIAREYLRGIGPDRLIVLDVPRLLADPRLVLRDESAA